jgi:hypothetical protein
MVWDLGGERRGDAQGVNKREFKWGIFDIV